VCHGSVELRLLLPEDFNGGIQCFGLIFNAAHGIAEIIL
jgi:hypothetical protein